MVGGTEPSASASTAAAASMAPEAANVLPIIDLGAGAGIAPASAPNTIFRPRVSSTSVDCVARPKVKTASGQPTPASASAAQSAPANPRAEGPRLVGEAGAVAQP